MANGDVTLTLSFSGTDDTGDAFSLSHTVSTSSVVKIKKDRIPVGTAAATSVLTFAAAASGLAITAIKKIVLINDDATNFIRIRVKDDGAEAYDIKLEAQDLHVINNRSLSVSATSAAFSAFASFDTIEAQADTAACDLIVLVYHT